MKAAFSSEVAQPETVISSPHAAQEKLDSVFPRRIEIERMPIGVPHFGHGRVSSWVGLSVARGIGFASQAWIEEKLFLKSKSLSSRFAI